MGTTETHVNGVNRQPLLPTGESVRLTRAFIRSLSETAFPNADGCDPFALQAARQHYHEAVIVTLRNGLISDPHVRQAFDALSRLEEIAMSACEQEEGEAEQERDRLMLALDALDIDAILEGAR